MNKTILFVASLMPTLAGANTDLSDAIKKAHMACGNISTKLADMKQIAGIATATTGVGTVASGIALGTGIAKAKVDIKIKQIEADLQAEIDDLNQLAATQTKIDVVPDFNVMGPSQHSESAEQKNTELTAAETKSKKLGNWRTGTLAVATATNVAGTILSSTNKIQGDLQTHINDCLAAVKTLADARMQAYLEQNATDSDLAYAEQIIRVCGAWDTVDISSINNRSTGATTAGGIGAGLGLAGTVVSAVANTQKVRDGDETKEKNLNSTANVLAGATTLAGGAATVFNATQISAIKRAVTVATECEKAIRQ